MKSIFLKFKRDRLPGLKSLRPQIFNTEFLWFTSLWLSLLILIITGLIGFKLFYSQYFETYKKSQKTENFENIINVNRIKNFIGKRSDIINKEISLPKDPSL